MEEAVQDNVLEFKEAVKRRKLQYDRSVKFDTHAVRNDNATWKKKYFQLKKEAVMTQAKEKELQDWRMLWNWVEAHAHPPTRKWFRHLKKNGPPPAPDRHSI